MGKCGERRLKRTHSLFIDDLKVYQENHKRLEVVNEMIVQASHDTGAQHVMEYQNVGKSFSKEER